MNLEQFEKMKLALRTPKVQILLVLFIVFIASSNWILSKAFDSMHPTQFNNVFWVYATLELMLALVVLIFCSRFGSLKFMKFGQLIQTLIEKLSSRLLK